MSTTEVDDSACTGVIATVSGGTIAGVEADIAGARSVSISVDPEDSIGALIDISRAPADGVCRAALANDVSDVLSTGATADAITAAVCT